MDDIYYSKGVRAIRTMEKSDRHALLLCGISINSIDKNKMGDVQYGEYGSGRKRLL